MNQYFEWICLATVLELIGFASGISMNFQMNQYGFAGEPEWLLEWIIMSPELVDEYRNLGQSRVIGEEVSK